MAHHVADEDARLVIGNAHDMKEIAADQTRRLIEVGETQACVLCRGGGRKKRIFLWQERLLQFHRHAQVGFHLVVPRPDLALFGLELENVPPEQRVLYFEERLRGNQPDKVAGAIDQQHIVVKFLVTTRKHGRQHCADRVADRNANFVFA